MKSTTEDGKKDRFDLDLKLSTGAGIELGRGVDPIEVFEHYGKWAFEPDAEKLAEIYRRYVARQKARGLWS